MAFFFLSWHFKKHLGRVENVQKFVWAEIPTPLYQVLQDLLITHTIQTRLSPLNIPSAVGMKDGLYQERPSQFVNKTDNIYSGSHVI